MTLTDLGKKLNTLADNLPTNASTLVKKVAEDVHTHVVVYTPVKTGKARSNWLVTLREDSSDVIPTHGVEGSISTTLNEGRSVIQNAKKGDSIHIVNNVDYIGELNEGSSTQAPAGFVQSAVVSAVESIEENVKVILEGF